MQNVRKLDERAQEAIFLGYADQSTGSKLADAQTKDRIFPRVVLFEKDKVATYYQDCLETETGMDAEPTIDVKQTANFDQPRQVDHESALKDDDLHDFNPDVEFSAQKVKKSTKYYIWIIIEQIVMFLCGLIVNMTWI